MRPAWRRRLIGYPVFFALLFLSAWLFLVNPVLPGSGVAFPSKRAEPATLSAHVGLLTALDPPRALPRGMKAAARYVRSTWEGLGLTVTAQKVPAPPDEFENLSVFFGPPSAERIVIGAHYDCYGRNPGADDNASGTAALLELARLLKESAPPLEHGVELVAYPTEEPPYFTTDEMGSSVHAKSLRAAGVRVRFMMSLEMVGDFSDAPDSQQYPMPALKMMYPSKGNFIALVGRPQEWSLVREIKSRMTGIKEIAVDSINAPTSVPGLDWSDHRNYWREGFPAVMVTDTSFYRNHRYHTREDTADRLDYRRMAEVVDAVYAAVATE